MHNFVNWQMLPYVVCWILKKANQIIILNFVNCNYSVFRSATPNMFICFINWLTNLINTLVDQYVMTIFIKLCFCSLICVLLAFPIYFVPMKIHSISLSAFYLFCNLFVCLNQYTTSQFLKWNPNMIANGG